MKKQLLLSAVCMVLLTVCLSCEKSSKDSFLAVENTELKFSSNGSSQTLRVTSDGDWSIMDAPDWLEFSSTRGVNSQDVTVTARPNLTGVRREGAFVVRTNNGSQQQVVRVIQSGEGDVDKFNVPDVSKRWLNGNPLTAGGKDSIYIDANIPWTVEGPDWMTASFQDAEMSINGQVEKEGSGSLVFYPRSGNDNNEDREGVLRISSPRSNVVYNIPVAQLGRGHVVPRNPLLLAHGYATSLKFGKSVTRIRFKLFEGKALDSEVTIEASNSTWDGGNFTENTYLTFSGRIPNTQYELCIRTVDAENYYNNDGLNRFVFTTLSDANPPLAEITDINIEGNKLNYKIKKNANAIGYYRINTTSSSFLSANETSVAYLLRDRIRNYPDTYPLRTDDASLSTDVSSDRVIATWAVDPNQQFSPVISRYVYRVNNGARAMLPAKPVHSSYIGDYLKDAQMFK